MNDRLRVRLALGAMMFFHYAAWGAWAPVLGETLGRHLNASGTQIGGVYGILWLACILAPFLGGQLADRVIPGQVFLGIAAIGCSVSAFFMSQSTQIPAFSVWMWVWSLLFAATIGIANSVTMYHLTQETDRSPEQQERDFSLIRTAGTVAWIIVAFAVAWSKVNLQLPVAGETGPDSARFPVSEMLISAIAAAFWAVASFLVPNTPPVKEKSDPWAFTRAFSLFRTVPGFTAFILISFVASTEFQFFYTLSAQFLADLGVPEAWLGPAKSISQAAEIVALAFFLPISLKMVGMRWTLVIGTLAWSIRYFIFAMQEPFWLVLASLSFHGIGFAFVFITSYLYIDRVAPRDVRASAQSLFTLVTLGLGNYLGSTLSGLLQDRFTSVAADGAKVVNWPPLFVIPAVAVLISAIAFYLTFREPSTSERDELSLPAVPAGGEITG